MKYLIPLILLVACGGPVSTNTPVPADIVAQATAVGAKYGLWPADQTWDGWSFETYSGASVPCNGFVPQPGFSVSACTRFDLKQTLILDGIRGNQLANLVHEMNHVVEGTSSTDHCDWSQDTALVQAIESTGGVGGDFNDPCAKEQCTFYPQPQGGFYAACVSQ